MAPTSVFMPVLEQTFVQREAQYDLKTDSDHTSYKTPQILPVCSCEVFDNETDLYKICKVDHHLPFPLHRLALLQGPSYYCPVQHVPRVLE